MSYQEEITRNIERVLSALRALPEVEKIETEMPDDLYEVYEIKAWVHFHDSHEVVVLEMY